MTLTDFFHQHPKAALALSGGIDSAYLLYEALQSGAQVRPYFVKTVFQPAFELNDAKWLTAQLGVELTVLNLDILCDSGVASNPDDRCYYCKRALMTCLYVRAMQDGFDLLLDGTNASDDAGDRPGMRALMELHVRSPLRECGLTKDEIRRRAREAGLFLWNKPAYACLATRVPAGVPFTVDLLHRIECAEDCLFQLGFSDFRVRVFHEAARIQLPPSQMAAAWERREEMLRLLKPYFSTILLDMEGRT